MVGLVAIAVVVRTVDVVERVRTPIPYGDHVVDDGALRVRPTKEWIDRLAANVATPTGTIEDTEPTVLLDRAVAPHPLLPERLLRGPRPSSCCG